MVFTGTGVVRYGTSASVVSLLIRIQHYRVIPRRYGTYFFRIRIVFKNWKNLLRYNIIIFFNIAIYLSLGLLKDAQASGEAFSPEAKREHPAIKNTKYLYFSFLCVFLSFWIRVRIPNGEDADSPEQIQ
jgi:hypothetical protein